MTYQSEVNNGGHHQYFFNTENNGDVHKDIETLCGILPDILKDNIQTAFKSSVESEQDKNIETNEEILEKCDDVFYANEEKSGTVKMYLMNTNYSFSDQQYFSSWFTSLCGISPSKFRNRCGKENCDNSQQALISLM